MARTRKSIQPLNLYKYDVLIEDKATRSDYFKVSQFDGNFYGGRNAFLLAGASVLKPNSRILVEILNKDGTTVYSAPVTSFIEGNSRLIQIEVYNDTPIGPGKLVLLGCADTYLDGTPIPTIWQEKYNVRWITDVIISPLIENKTPIRFEKTPSAIATEKFYYAPSSSLFVEQLKVPVDVELTQKYYNVFPNGYIVKSRGIEQYESEYLGGFVTGTITISNSTVSETASINLPITKIYNSTLAESQGTLIYTKNKTLIADGFLSSSGIYTTNINPYGEVLVSSSINIEYNKLTTLDIGVNISFAKLRIVDLKTISGEIHKIRLSYKPSTEPGEFVALGDINTTVAELLTIDSSSKIVNTGQFIDTKVSDYWYSETMSLQKNISNPTLPLYYVSSSLSSSYLPIIRSSTRLLNAISATPQIVNNEYIDNVSYFIGTKNTNTVELFPRVEYTLKFDAIVSKTSASITLNQNDYSLEVYLIKEAGVDGKLLETDVRGQLLGTLTPTSTFQRQNFENTELNFIPKIITNGNFGLRFVAYGGFWDIADVSIKPAQEPLFSPDEIDVLIPNINYFNSVLTFKVDYLDVNNNSINISTFSTPTYFTGSYSTTGPTGNTSVSIGVTPPPFPVIGDLWWNSEEGQLKIYYFDGDSYQWVDASGESIETGSFGPFAVSSSYALTSSYALNGGGGGGSSVSSSYPFSVSGSTLYSTYDIPPSSFSTANTILIGTQAGGNTTDADYTVFIGTEAGTLSTASHDSIYIGEHAGRNSNESYWSNYIGQYAGTNASESYWSNYIGPYAGDSSTNGHFSNFIGPNAGNNSTDGNFSNFLGENAGGNSTAGYFSNFIGPYAGDSSTYANASNFIGGDAGYSSDSGSYSNFIGNYTGRYTLGASYSTLIGYNVGTAVGAGMSIKSNNIIIGTNITLEADRQDSINLGGIIFATGSYSTTTGNPYSGSVENGKVGINVVNPQYALDVSGAGYFSGGLTGSLFGTASHYNVPANLRTSTIGIVIDGGNTPILVGEKAEILIPFNCTIQSWALLADRSGSATVEVWKSTYAAYPPTSASSIVGSAKPSISSNVKNTSSTLTGWTTSISKNDTIKFYVSESSTIQRLNLTLEVLRP